MRDITICYGMTEALVMTQTYLTTGLAERVSTVGTPHPHIEIKIVDHKTGRTREMSEVGEICARGYAVVQGYWNAPELTREVL